LQLANLRLFQLLDRLLFFALLRICLAQMIAVDRTGGLLPDDLLEGTHGAVGKLLPQINLSERIGYVGEMGKRLAGTLGIGERLIEVPVVLHQKKSQVVQGHAVFRIQPQAVRVILTGFLFGAGGIESLAQRTQNLWILRLLTKIDWRTRHAITIDS
jgi:hypothetical protein